MKLGPLHHVGIAVPSLESALPFYRDTLGMRAGGTRELPDQRVRAVILAGPEGRVELVQPTDAESGVARFLAERGRPTLHHVCFVVEDLARALDELAARGVELVDRTPRPGVEGIVAFLHPRAADGVLVELVDRSSVSAPPVP